MLVHVQPLPVHLFLWAAFQQLCPQPGEMQGIVKTRGQEPVLGLPEPYPAGLAPLIKPVHILPKSLPSFQHTDTLTHLGVVRNLWLRVYSMPLATSAGQIINRTEPMDTTWMWHHSPPHCEAQSQQFLTQQRVCLLKAWAGDFFKTVLSWKGRSQRLCSSPGGRHAQLLPLPGSGSPTN